MPAATCPLPTYERTIWERARELEWLLDNQPATPAQREAWQDELELIDESMRDMELMNEG